jgi:hypothetical protein
MTIWVITYSTGFDSTNMFVEAYSTEQEANNRASELQAKITNSYSGYSVEEYNLDTRNSTYED